MKTQGVLLVLILGLCFSPVCYGEAEKTRIFIVSSYHKEYLWSQSTHEGVCKAMLQGRIY